MSQEAFDLAVKKSKELTKMPSNDQLLGLYSFYKQATEGNVKTDRPTGFDFKAMAKWDAWKKLEGTASDAAMKQYIDLVNELAKQ